MDKLGLLSLQVPILASSTETADGSSCLLVAANEALPTRYVSPHPEAGATADSGEHTHRGGVAAAAAAESGSSFAAVDSSSSCSPCFWDDNPSFNDSSKGHRATAAAAGIDYWAACSQTVAKVESRSSVATAGASSTTLSISHQRQDSGRQTTMSLLPQKVEPGCTEEAIAGPEVVTAAQKQEGEGWKSVTKRRDEVKQGSSAEDSCLAGAEASVRMNKAHVPGNVSETSASQDDVPPNSPAHAAATTSTTTETAATGPEASVLGAAISKAAKGTVEDSSVLQTAVGGVGSCSKLKGGSADDHLCGTGTPTTRFSTEQDEDGVAPPAIPHTNPISAGATASSSGTVAEGREDSCSSGECASLLVNGEMATHSPPYGRQPSSLELQFGGVDAAAVPAERDVEEREEGQQQHCGDTRELSWHQGGQQGGEGSGEEMKTQRQHLCQEDAALQSCESFLHDGETMGELLAAAAAVVEQQVHELTAAGGAPVSQQRRARLEEARVARTVGDESADITAAAVANASAEPTNAACFGGVDVLRGRTGKGTGAAARTSGGGVPVSTQSEQPSSEQQTDEAALSLTLALDTSLLEVGQEAGIIPGSDTSTSSTGSEERSLAVTEMREGSEGSTTAQGQSSKKQTTSSERVTQGGHDSGAKVGAPTAGGGGRAVGTRGGGGATQQQTNGSGGCAADLPEDPELVECLKGLLAALPRKKDAEARWLLSGEMRFVRPYALQIVDVWKIHLGEAGRTALKKDISERTQADATLKRRVLAISKLKMATLEELVQIAELADLLVRTLQIANMYEAERQVASVTRQSASRRALSAAVTSLPPHASAYYTGSNSTSDPTATAGGSSSSHSASAGLAGSAVGGPAGSGRNASYSAQTNVNTRHNASAYSPSRASLPSSVSAAADSSPVGHHRVDALSPRSRSACSTSGLLSPPAGGGAGGSGAVDESSTLSEEHSHFCHKGPPAAEGNNSSNSPTSLYDSLEKTVCSRAAGSSAASVQPSATSALAEINGAARACSPRASSEIRFHFLGVPESSENGGGSAQPLPHQHMQQEHLQKQQLQPVQQHQSERGHQQPFSGSSDEDARCSETEVSLVAQELRETLTILQQGGAQMHRGKEALPSLPTAKARNARGGMMSPSEEWTESMDKASIPELQQWSTTKKMMLPQPRRSQQAGIYVEKDEDAIRAAELLAAFADLRSSLAADPHASQQAATDISSSSTMAHEELLNFTLEAAAAGVAASPRGRALVAALSDNHRLARILDLSTFPCFDRGDNSTGGVRRRPQEHEVLTLLRVAALSGDEAAATALAGRLLCVASQGSTSNSSSSSEAEGAAIQEFDGELGPAEHQTVRRKRVRRSTKSSVRAGNKNRSAATGRDIRLDESDTLLLQQLHQQLQQLQQQQLLQVRQRAGEDLSAALAGEVQACMSALEAEAAAGKIEPLPQEGEKLYCKRKKSCQTTAADKSHGQNSMQDEETEEEDSSQTSIRGREAAALQLATVDRNNRRQTSAGRPAAADCTEGSSGIVGAANSGFQSDTACKGTITREDDSDHQVKNGSARRNALFNTEKDGGSCGATEAKTGGRCAGLRLSRWKEEEIDGGNGTVRCSEERTAAADAPDEKTTDAASRSTAARPAARTDVDSEIRSNTASRSASRGGTSRCNSAVEGFPGGSIENSASCSRGRNGVRQGRENFWVAAPYSTRRSAAAAAGASAGDGGELNFADTGKHNGSRSASRAVAHGEPEAKVALIEKTETEAGGIGGPGDSVAEQCAREAKQLLERALKVNDALGFVPASCRLTVSGTSRDQETSSSGNNSGTGTRAKRAREQVSAGDWDTGAFLQVLATVCLMCLKQ